MTYWFPNGWASLINIASDLGLTCQVSHSLSADVIQYKLLDIVKDFCSFEVFFISNHCSSIWVQSASKANQDVDDKHTYEPEV